MLFVIKFAGFILITAAATLTGVSLSAGLKKRAETLNWYVRTVGIIGDKIRYSSAELSTVLEEIPNHDGFFAVHSPFRVEVLQNGLNPEDAQTVNEFFSRLGMGDVAEQINICKMYMKELEFRYEDAKREFKEKSKPIKTLGFFAGLGISIILI